jgi:hypothetical protein
VRGGAKSPEKAPRPGCCSSCPYWKHTPGNAQKVPVSSTIANAPADELESGLCYFERPELKPVPVQSAVQPGVMQVSIERFFKPMLENEFCPDHPERAANREYLLEQMRERARRDVLSFDPAKHGDAHAGFSGVPSLEAAKAMAAK